MANPIKLLFNALLFLILWAMFLAEWLITVGTNYILKNNSTGIEAFFYNNLNFLVFICFILMLVLAGVFGGNTE